MVECTKCGGIKPRLRWLLMCEECLLAYFNDEWRHSRVVHWEMSPLIPVGAKVGGGVRW